MNSAHKFTAEDRRVIAETKFKMRTHALKETDPPMPSSSIGAYYVEQEAHGRELMGSWQQSTLDSLHKEPQDTPEQLARAAWYAVIAAIPQFLASKQITPEEVKWCILNPKEGAVFLRDEANKRTPGYATEIDPRFQGFLGVLDQQMLGGPNKTTRTVTNADGSKGVVLASTGPGAWYRKNGGGAVFHNVRPSEAAAASAAFRSSLKKHSVSRGAPGLDARDAAALDRSMGVSTLEPVFFEKRSDGTAIFHNVRPSDMARLSARPAPRKHAAGPVAAVGNDVAAKPAGGLGEGIALETGRNQVEDLVAENASRMTSDEADYVRDLARDGKFDEALEFLRDVVSPRPMNAVANGKTADEVNARIAEAAGGEAPKPKKEPPVTNAVRLTSVSGSRQRTGPATPLTAPRFRIGL